jgi:hypothetical protein
MEDHRIREWILRFKLSKKRNIDRRKRWKLEQVVYLLRKAKEKDW